MPVDGGGAQTAAWIGAVSASVVSLGLLPLFLSSDGEGAWVDGGFVLVVIGSVALALGPLILQIRRGIGAMRRVTSSLRPVLLATFAFSAGGTIAFLVFMAAMATFASSTSDTHWSDLPSVFAALGAWAYAFVSAGVVVIVVEVVRRLERRRASRHPRPAGSDSSMHPSRPS
jgi:hypothetical protein